MLSGKNNNGRALREGDKLINPGIDDFFDVMSWDDWEGEGRIYVEVALTRRFEARL